jgi:hypothetical protein
MLYKEGKLGGDVMENILIASIPSLITLVGVILTNRSNKDKIINNIDKKNTTMIAQVKEDNMKVINEVKTEMKVNQAVTDTKIEELTREVREHNNFAKRMPVVEEGIENLKEKVNYFHKV